MQISPHAKCLTTVRLDGHEMFRANNDKGLPFTVRQILYQGGSDCSLSGFAILVDGADGAIQRYASVKMTSIDTRMKEAILQAHINEVMRLGKETFNTNRIL